MARRKGLQHGTLGLGPMLKSTHNQLNEVFWVSKMLVRQSLPECCQLAVLTRLNVAPVIQQSVCRVH